MFSNEFNEDDIMSKPEFTCMQQMIDDPTLRDNQMYIKLRTRLEAFFVNAEKIRNLGMNDQQKHVIQSSGFSQSYRIGLYKCLRKMLLGIINQKDLHIKLRQLRECYQWFFKKLMAMGALSKQEIDEEFKFLNPMSNHLGKVMKQALALKSKSVLSNEEIMTQQNKLMFEDHYEENTGWVAP